MLPVMREDRWPTPSELRARVWRLNLIGGIVLSAILFGVAPEVINDDAVVIAVRVMATAVGLVLVAVGIRLIRRQRRAKL